MMSQNDIIAEYIKTKYPEMLKSSDFAMFKISIAWRSVVNGFKETINNIDFNKLAEAVKELNNKEIVINKKDGDVDGKS